MAVETSGHSYIHGYSEKWLQCLKVPNEGFQEHYCLDQGFLKKIHRKHVWSAKSVVGYSQGLPTDPISIREAMNCFCWRAGAGEKLGWTRNIPRVYGVRCFDGPSSL